MTQFTILTWTIDIIHFIRIPAQVFSMCWFSFDSRSWISVVTDVSGLRPYASGISWRDLSIKCLRGLDVESKCFLMGCKGIIERFRKGPLEGSEEPSLEIVWKQSLGCLWASACSTSSWIWCGMSVWAHKCLQVVREEEAEEDDGHAEHPVQEGLRFARCCLPSGRGWTMKDDSWESIMVAARVFGANVSRHVFVHIVLMLALAFVCARIGHCGRAWLDWCSRCVLALLPCHLMPGSPILPSFPI